MKPGITSGKKISNSPSFQKGRQYRMEAAFDGENKGFQFAIVGNNHALKENIKIDGIVRCIKGDRHSHRGCSWKYITLKEAVNYPQGLSKGGVL